MDQGFSHLRLDALRDAPVSSSVVQMESIQAHVILSIRRCVQYPRSKDQGEIEGTTLEANLRRYQYRSLQVLTTECMEGKSKT